MSTIGSVCLSFVDCFALSATHNMVVPKNKKIQCMTINEKYKILKEMEKGRKAADICKEHPSLSKQTLSNWKKNKGKIYAIVDANASSASKNGRKRKCVRSSAYVNVEKAL